MTPEDTDRLIAELAKNAAGDTARPQPYLPLSIAIALSFVLAIALAMTVFGSGSDVAAAFSKPWTYWKLLCMAMLALGALTTMRDLAHPGYAPPRFAIVLGAMLLMGLGALFDPSSVSLSGRTLISVPICLTAIVLQSLPGVVLIMLGLRAATTTTRPTLTGAAAGLLSGAIGAIAYAFVCRNDGGLFVFVWYGIAVSIATVAGAALGRRMLAW